MLRHMGFRHCTAVFLALSIAAVWPAGAAGGPAQGEPDASGSASFKVFLRGNAVGTEEVDVRQTGQGWQITGSGRFGPPLDLTTRRVVIRYDAEWQPLQFRADAIVRGAATTIETSFADGRASSVVTQAGAVTRKQDEVSAGALVLPNLFFASYEALALQLGTIPVGEQFRAYVVPETEIPVKHTARSSRKIETAKRVIDVRTHGLTFMNPGGALEAVIWTDEQGRLLKFEVAAQSLVVMREDIASVSARLLTVSRAGDQSVRFPGNGFTLAGTLSQPSGRPPEESDGRFPAVIMVGGSGATDRDETVAGIPIFGQIAGGLADAGYYVLRYDKRGVGQSGGRLDGTTLREFSDDVIAAFKFLRDRKDVDKDRIALFGHSEGGLVALMAASREDDIAALVLAAAPSGTGGELVLEQQRHLLANMELTPEEQQARMELQVRIQAAVVGDGPWEGIPEPLRRQADTDWFRTFLQFSPADVLRKVEPPILILQGSLDTQVPPHHADRLAELALTERKRRTKDSVEVTMFDGVNHLLVPAKTGELSEYSTLTNTPVDQRIIDTTATWLGEAMPPGR
jgi:pimeloyl-ACP methyl ester carboxylesterase